MNNINLTKDELDKLVKSQDLEVYTQEQFKGFIVSNEELLIKGETSELDELEKSEYETLQEEIKSFSRVEVYNTAPNSSSRIEKSIVLVRPKQVEWSEEDVLVKSEDGTERIEKAKSGIYTNSILNRKLGRVGQKYGQKKESNEDSKYEEIKVKNVKVGETYYFDEGTNEPNFKKVKAVSERISPSGKRVVMFHVPHYDKKSGKSNKQELVESTTIFKR